MAQYDIAGPLIDGASLMSRIMGQHRAQKLEKDRIDTEKADRSADFVSRTGYTPDQLNDPSSGASAAILGRNKAAADAKQKLEAAQADYFSGRNGAYADAAKARAGAMAARTAQGGTADLQKQIKDYDQMAMIDPDGSKGIYTPQKAQEHAALLNQFNLNNRIATGAAVTGNDIGPKPAPPGFIARGAQALMGYFGGGDSSGQPTPAAAAPGGAQQYTRYAKGANGSRVGFNPQSNAWEPVGGL